MKITKKVELKTSIYVNKDQCSKDCPHLKEDSQEYWYCSLFDCNVNESMYRCPSCAAIFDSEENAIISEIIEILKWAKVSNDLVKVTLDDHCRYHNALLNINTIINSYYKEKTREQDKVIDNILDEAIANVKEEE